MPGRTELPHVQGVATLPSPREARLVALRQLWDAKRGARLMPARSDFLPSEFKPLLPNICLIDVVPPPERYRIRLMGEEMGRMLRGNPHGKTVEDIVEPDASGPIRALMDVVIATKAPVFRAGNVYWSEDRSYVAFEGCTLPLSEDGINVTMVLGVVIFSGA